MFYNRKPSARRGYLFDTTEPLFPFGFGLSYTTLRDRCAAARARGSAKHGTVEVAVDVRNVGERAGDEVVQLYVRDKVSSVTRPVKELKGFQRVTLAPGAQRTVRFTLDCAGILAVERRDEASRRARRVRHHGRAEFGRPEVRLARHRRRNA